MSARETESRARGSKQVRPGVSQGSYNDLIHGLPGRPIQSTLLGPQGHTGTEYSLQSKWIKSMGPREGGRPELASQEAVGGCGAGSEQGASRPLPACTDPSLWFVSFGRVWPQSPHGCVPQGCLPCPGLQSPSGLLRRRPGEWPLAVGEGPRPVYT